MSQGRESRPTHGLPNFMKCIECSRRVHPERSAVHPQIKTCSAECSAARKRRLRSEAGTRCHKRQRAKEKKG